ncbi:MAG: diaminopimelate epimerase [Phycisphaerae bacterium]|nr:diaminopimelate epimerase [Phycisphaerae bacterium]
MKVPFVKMHGLGNDYVFIDGRDGVELRSATVIRISDRREGIGGDGVVMLEAPVDVANHARMRIFNADGSDGGVCGNGLRCLARWLRQDGFVAEGSIRVETPGGVVELLAGPMLADGTVRVEATMPSPRLESAMIPSRIPGVGPAEPVIDRNAGEILAGRDLPPTTRLTLVSMGNPHAVLSLGGVGRAELDRMIRCVGPKIECHPFFPERINVHLVSSDDRGGLRMSTWERGSGATRACGTGACAAVVALVAASGPGDDSWRDIELPGGRLEIAWSGRPTDPVRQRGPAVESFRGWVEIESGSAFAGRARSTP